MNIAGSAIAQTFARGCVFSASLCIAFALSYYNMIGRPFLVTLLANFYSFSTRDARCRGKLIQLLFRVAFFVLLTVAHHIQSFLDRLVYLHERFALNCRLNRENGWLSFKEDGDCSNSLGTLNL